MAKKYNQMPAEDIDSFKSELRHLKNTVDELRSSAEAMTGNPAKITNARRSKNPGDSGRSIEIMLCALADASTEYDKKLEEFLLRYEENLNEKQRKN